MRDKIKDGLTAIAGELPRMTLNPLSPLTWFRAIGTVAKAVKHTERLCKDHGAVLDGPAKKGLVVEWLNERIDIPLLGESAEARIIGMLIDATVEVLNATLGQKFGFAMSEDW